MKINFIADSLDRESGQGIYRYSAELRDRLVKEGDSVEVNGSGEVTHVQQPELIWRALFKKNVVVTFHDLIPLFIDERKKSFNLFFRISCFIALHKAKKIISISECTKKDILKYFKVPEKKMSVVYEDTPWNFYPISRPKNKRFTFGYAGGLGKRKNVEFILKLAKELPNVDFKIGGKGPAKEKLEELAKEMKLSNVHFMGFIPDKDYNEYFNSLDGFIFPSFYEGFGIPILEAMNCGIVPFISDRGSLPEIMDDAGIILNIEDLNESKNKILEFIKNPSLQKKLSNKALGRSKFFSWEKCTSQTRKIYEDVLK